MHWQVLLMSDCFKNINGMSNNNSKRMLNFAELAQYIGLRPQTIRNKFYAGEFPIPAKKIFSKVLWDKKDVDKFLDKLPKIDC